MASDRSMGLSLSCGDQAGIVSAVAGLLTKRDATFLRPSSTATPETATVAFALLAMQLQ